MTYSLLALLIFTVLLSPFTATARPKLDPKVAACVGRDILAFGASVTEATPYSIPLWPIGVKAIELYGEYKNPQNLLKFSRPKAMGSPRTRGISPIKKLANFLGSRNFTLAGAAFSQADVDWGTFQIESMFFGSLHEQFEKASVIVGVDAFYWDAIDDTCSQFEGTERAPENRIRQLVMNAKATGKILILGNVPIENPANVRIDSARTGVDGLWYPPQPSCVHHINAALENYCKVKHNCYLFDMKSMVDDINCGKAQPLWNGRQYKYFDLRPDGVHLSDAGSDFVAEQLYELLAANPPQVCQ